MSEETLTAYASAYPRVAEAREKLRDRLGRTHNAEAAAEIRKEFGERFERILAEHGLTREAYRRAEFAVSTDAESRAAFEGLRRRAGGAEGDAANGDEERPEPGATPSGEPSSERAEAGDAAEGAGAPGSDDEEGTRTGAGAAATEIGPARPAPDLAERGEAVFTGAGACFSCHGRDGTGTPLGPNLTDDEWLHVDGSYPAIVTLVETGVPEPKIHPAPMLPRGGTGIDDEQIRAVAAYVWSLSRGR